MIGPQDPPDQGPLSAHLNRVSDRVAHPDNAYKPVPSPTAKLKGISALAKGLLCRATCHKRWVSVKTLASLAGKAQFLYLAILVSIFFLLELHDVINPAMTWSDRVRITLHLKRNLEWCKDVPSYHNDAPIWTLIETHNSIATRVATAGELCQTNASRPEVSS